MLLRSVFGPCAHLQRLRALAVLGRFFTRPGWRARWMAALDRFAPSRRAARPAFVGPSCPSKGAKAGTLRHTKPAVLAALLVVVSIAGCPRRSGDPPKAPEKSLPATLATEPALVRSAPGRPDAVAILKVSLPKGAAVDLETLRADHALRQGALILSDPPLVHLARRLTVRVPLELAEGATPGEHSVVLDLVVNLSLGRGQPKELHKIRAVGAVSVASGVAPVRQNPFGQAAVHVTAPHQHASARAAAKGRCTVVHFTGDFCLECEAPERALYSDPAVVTALKAHQLIVVDMTNVTSAGSRSLRSRYNVGGLPHIAVHAPDGRAVDPLTRYPTSAEFVAWLSRSCALVPSP